MDERIQTAIAFIKDNPEKKIDLHALAEVACLAPVYFHRCFKQSTGLTPQKFVALYKMTEAYNLLTNSNSLIQEIAFQLGYDDYETFSRVFKRQYLISPADLRLIIRRVIEDLGKKIPTIVSFTKDEKEMFNQLHKVLDKKNVNPQDLSDLAVCLITPTNNRDIIQSRKVENKFSFFYDQTLASKLLTKIHSEKAFK